MTRESSENEGGSLGTEAQLTLGRKPLGGLGVDKWWGWTSCSAFSCPPRPLLAFAKSFKILFWGQEDRRE